MRYRIPLLAVMLMAPVGAFAQPLIQSQEGIALQNEILQLQQQLQSVQSQRNSGGGSSLGASSASGSSSSNALLPGLLTQVQQLQAQVQTLSGQVSVLQHQVDTQNAQTQQQIGDLKFQMTNGTSGASAAGAASQSSSSATDAGSAASTASAPAATAAVAAPATPRDALKTALQAYDQRNYRQAAASAQSIVTNHKTAPEAYRAQFLVAQSEAALGSSQNAAVAFYNTYNMNKAGAYAPRALLGLASSLTDLKQNTQACETLASLNSQFTTPSAGLKREIDKASERAHCS